MTRVKQILTGNIYGYLVVLDEYKKVGNKTYWLCKCECGNEKFVRSDHLKSGKVVSCGCYNDKLCSKLGKTKVKDLTGQQFGKLTVIKRVGSNTNQQSIWECRCECGNYRNVIARSLISGNTTSCGCYKKEKLSELMSTEYNNMLGRKGIDNPNYNPELSDEDRERNKCRTNTAEYIRFRRKAFKVNGISCDCCKQINKRRVVHHLDSWNINKGLRYEISNTVVLCEECHKEFHRIYGYGNNTKEQYTQFKNNMLIPR